MEIQWQFTVRYSSTASLCVSTHWAVQYALLCGGMVSQLYLHLKSPRCLSVVPGRRIAPGPRPPPPYWRRTPGSGRSCCRSFLWLSSGLARRFHRAEHRCFRTALPLRTRCPDRLRAWAGRGFPEREVWLVLCSAVCGLRPYSNALPAHTSFCRGALMLRSMGEREKPLPPSYITTNPKTHPPASFSSPAGRDDH